MSFAPGIRSPEPALGYKTQFTQKGCLSEQETDNLFFADGKSLGMKTGPT